MKKPLTVEEVLSIKEPADRVHMSLSPDHKWLAFCINGRAKGNKSTGVSMAVEGTAQWVCDHNSGHGFQIAPEAKYSWSGVWSPEGSTLAFFADIDGKARLWLWVSYGGTLKLASEILFALFLILKNQYGRKMAKTLL